MIKWFSKIVGRNPRLVEADKKLAEINGRADALIATVDGEERWMLRIQRESRHLPQAFECMEIKKDET